MPSLRSQLTSFALVGVLAFVSSGHASASGPPPSTASSRAAIEQAIAEHEYFATPDSRGVQAPNRGHDLRTHFGSDGIRVEGRSDAQLLLALRLARLGRGAELVAVSAGQVAAARDRVEIRRPGLVEWYVNGPDGLEQGFTLARRPAGAGALVLEMTLDGATAQPRGAGAQITAASGRRLAYDHLIAFDARGQRLAATIHVVDPARMRISIDDNDSVYPLVIDPLLSAVADTHIVGTQNQHGFGYSLAAAGDVNGDGYGDVIVGAPSYDAGQADEGAAFVFLGSAGGVTAATELDAATRLEGNQVDAGFGASVAGAGDVDNDGYDDVIVGAPNYSGRGGAFIFRGSASGIANGGPASAATRILDTAQPSSLGHSVAGLGDVDADGYADVGVSAYAHFTPPSAYGDVMIFRGRPGGIPHGGRATASAIVSGAPGTLFGYSIGRAGDVNGDGYDDLLAGAPGGFSDKGDFYVFHGGPGGIPSGPATGAATRIESDTPGAQLGVVIGGGGDIDADGYDDLIAGRDPQRRVFLFRGRAGGIPTGVVTSADTIVQQASSLNLGDAVAIVGDVDADGYDDALISDPTAQIAANLGGAAYLFRGSASGIPSGNPANADAYLSGSLSFFGSSLSSAGDVNGDGYSDMIAGQFAGNGGAFVFLGGASWAVGACNNGIDDDGDGSIDFGADPGCSNSGDDSEREATLACDDGLDNDSDGSTDYPGDPGCAASTSGTEGPRCDDDLDNDRDGRIDWDGAGVGQPDPQCTSPLGNNEQPACGLGVEMVALVGALELRRRRLATARR